MAGNHELFALDEDFQALATQAPLKLFKARNASLAGC
jgi:hypothetical protein